MERTTDTKPETGLGPDGVGDALDMIPGAYERAQLGVRQAEAGHTISIDELERR